MENLITYKNICKIHVLCCDCPFKLIDKRYKTYMRKCQYGKFRRK